MEGEDLNGREGRDGCDMYYLQFNMLSFTNRERRVIATGQK